MCSTLEIVLEWIKHSSKDVLQEAKVPVFVVGDSPITWPKEVVIETVCMLLVKWIDKLRNFFNSADLPVSILLCFCIILTIKISSFSHCLTFLLILQLQSCLFAVHTFATCAILKMLIEMNWVGPRIDSVVFGHKMGWLLRCCLHCPLQLIQQPATEFSPMSQYCPVRRFKQFLVTGCAV